MLCLIGVFCCGFVVVDLVVAVPFFVGCWYSLCGGHWLLVVNMIVSACFCGCLVSVVVICMCACLCCVVVCGCRACVCCWFSLLCGVCFCFVV